MIHKLIASMALFGILFCSDALCGQVTLKNGDRLTGTILQTDGEKLNIKSDYA